MKDQIVPVELKRGDRVHLNAYLQAGVLEHDEYIKADTSLESLQKLKPAFKKDSLCQCFFPCHSRTHSKMVVCFRGGRIRNRRHRRHV